MSTWFMPVRIAVVASVLVCGAFHASASSKADVPAACRSATREYISLHGTWDYQAASSAGQEAPRADAWSPLELPVWMKSPEHGHAWFRRTVDIPAGWSGRSISLRAADVSAKVAVIVNGKSLPARITGGSPPQLFDISALVRPGEANEILLKLWDVRELRLDMNKGAGKRDANHLHIIKYQDDWFNFGIADNIGLQALPRLHIDNVRVLTSTRRNKIYVSALVTNASGKPFRGALSGKVAAAGMLNPDIEQREYPDADYPDISSTRIDIPAGKSRVVNLSATWSSPIMWWPDYPHLSNLSVELTGAEGQIDVYPVRFGFREVWRDGIDVFLNGAGIHLRVTFKKHIPKYREKASYYGRFRKFKRYNWNLFRTHVQPWPERAYEAADEVGMMMALESAASFGSRYAMEHPDFWKSYDRHVRNVVPSFWNHPSVVIWSTGNELMSQSRRPDPDGFLEDNLAKIGRLYKELDPTRLIMFEGDIDPGGVADFINEHYPVRYGNYMIPQDMYFTEKTHRFNCEYKRHIPYKYDRKKPYFVGETLWFPRGGPVQHAALSGDRVFVDYMSKGYGDSWRLDGTRTSARSLMATAFRWQKLGGFVLPSAHVDYRDIRSDLFAPITVLVRKMPGAHFAGKRATYTAMIVNDSYRERDLLFRWRVELEGGLEVAHGEERLGIKAGRDVKREVTFAFPDVLRRGKAMLTLDLVEGDRLHYRKELPLRVYPAAVPQVETHGRRVGLFDPGKTALKPLQRIGLSPVLCDRVDAGALADLNLLVVGPNALRDLSRVDTDAISARVAAGMNVLVLAQAPDTDLSWLPVRTTANKNTGATMGHMPTSHPMLALAGVGSDDLRFWAPDNVIAETTLVKPWRGSHRAVVETGSGAGLHFAAVLDVPHGRGAFVLNQMLCVAKFDIEPAARAMLAGAVEYGLTTVREPQRVAVLIQPESPLNQALLDLGVVHDNVRGRLASMNLRDYGVLIIDSTTATFDELLAETNQDAVFNFLHKQGGTLWIHDADESISRIAGGFSGMIYRMPISAGVWGAGTGRVALKTGRDSPLIRGLSNQTLWWQDANVASHSRAWREMKDPMVLHPLDINEHSAPDDCVQHLLRDTGLVTIQTGNGQVILDQIRWAEHPKYRNKGLQYASVLLTNLDVDFGEGDVRPVSEEDCVFIDLGAHCNQGFADEVSGDGKGGWTDQGSELDLRNLPVGRKKWVGVPFQVIDPATNNGKSCIVMRGNRGMNFPEQVDGIKVGRKLDQVRILHGSAWAGSGQTVGEYIFEYADGKEERVAVVEGTHVHDWYWGAMKLAEADPAWVGAAKQRSGMALYSMTWKNPRPDVPIKSIHIVAGTVGPPQEGVLPSGMLGVVAITGVTRPGSR